MRVCGDVLEEDDGGVDVENESAGEGGEMVLMVSCGMEISSSLLLVSCLACVCCSGGNANGNASSESVMCDSGDVTVEDADETELADDMQLGVCNCCRDADEMLLSKWRSM